MKDLGVIQPLVVDVDPLELEAVLGRMAELAPAELARLDTPHIRWILGQPDVLAELERRIDGAWIANLLDLLAAYDALRNVVLERSVNVGGKLREGIDNGVAQR